MAIDDDLDVAQPGSGATKGSSGTGKLLVVSLLMSLLMSGAVGAGVYFLLKNDMAAQQQEDPDADGEEEKKPEKPKDPAIYLSLEEPFIVNLSTQVTRFLQITVELMARDQEVIDAVEEHRPLLRNNLLLLFSAQTPESIGSSEGKEELRREALAEVQTTLEELGEPAEVEDLYFTSLVVQ